MIRPEISGNQVILEILGIDKMWGFKSRIIIPLNQITGVKLEKPTFGRKWWQVLRAPGIHWPGVITVGTYYYAGKRGFWDIRRPERAAVLTLHDHYYDEIVMEVTDAEGFVRELANRLAD
jgi:hypothetical protein